MTTFNERLKELRTSKGLSQKQLSVEIGVSDRGIQRYEYGEREPSMSTLIALAEYFQVSIDYLVGRTDKPDVNK